MNIYVSNLSYNVQAADLKEIFAPYGVVTSATVISDKFTGKSRGFGFVEMEDEAAKKAIAALDNSMVDGRSIKLMEARRREERPAPSNGVFGGGYSKSKW
ncbi:RNA recognition motif domain-containing protein [Pseudocnuella soli]|uniref:RNA recognition motif domain-containing protein n=1 Tax=Pseudocnuella soli TaxID=2502779 RepID=UPI00104F4653|nr:RNA-binding protein [Pseudocnuella soli]